MTVGVSYARMLYEGGYSMSFGAQLALIFMAGLTAVGFCVLAFSLLAMYRQLRGMSGKVTALIDQAEGVLGTLQETAVSVSERAEKVSSEVAGKAGHIAELSEQVAERVAQRVDTTSSIEQEAISGPMINLASIRAGVGKGIEVWQELQKAKGGNGK